MHDKSFYDKRIFEIILWKSNGSYKNIDLIQWNTIALVKKKLHTIV